jgi:ribosomal protein L11 methyltransferase
MDNIYIEYNFTCSPKEPATEILVAELGNVGFESFVENENGVTAYIQKIDWSAEILADIFVLNSKEFSIDYNQNEVPQTNWNEECRANSGR